MRIDMVITPCKTGVKEYFANLCKGFSKQQRKFEQLSEILKHLFHSFDTPIARTDKVIRLNSLPAVRLLFSKKI